MFKQYSYIGKSFQELQATLGMSPEGLLQHLCYGDSAFTEAIATAYGVRCSIPTTRTINSRVEQYEH